jgi:TatD DNase family protein
VLILVKYYIVFYTPLLRYGTNLKPYINIHSHKRNHDDDVFVLRNADINEVLLMQEDEKYSLGFHPWFIDENSVSRFELLKELIVTNKNVYAIGECGLDRNIPVDFEFQKLIFSKQVALANTCKMPMIIHCVRAFYEVIGELKTSKNKMPVVYHGYNNSFKIAATLMQHNGYLSFGKSLLQPNNNTADVFKQIPLSRVFLENDESVLTIQEVYEKAAELKSISMKELQKQLQTNFEEVFKNG